MSTGLTVYQRNDFLALAEGSDVAEALRENMDEGGFNEQDLVQVKTPSGGGSFWEVNGPSGKEALPYIQGVIVFRCQKGLLWPSEEPGETRPVLMSDDMKTAKLCMDWQDVPTDMQLVLEKHELTAEEVTECTGIIDPAAQPRLFWWDGPKKLPYCEYGSSTKPGSKGKRAKDKQILYVLRKNEGLPLRLELGPTSIKPVRQFFNQMSDLPHCRCEVKIGLKQLKNESGKDYSIATFERCAVLDKEAGDMIAHQYKRVIKAAHEAGKLNVVASDAGE
jgi:hypothetical protein